MAKRHVQDYISTRSVTGCGIRLAQCLPWWVGRVPVWLLSNWLVASRRAIYRTVARNLSWVMQAPESSLQVERAARRLFFHAGQTYHDLFHTLAQGPDALRSAVWVAPEEWAPVKEALDMGRGLMVAGVHMSNFDLATLSITARGYEFLALGLKQPTSGFQLLNEVRTAGGMIVQPVDEGWIRQAIRHLRAGGGVITGVDRPLSPDDPPITFLGRPARLPTGHVRLALKTGAALVTAVCTYGPGQGYVAHLSPPIQWERKADRDADVRAGAEAVLAYAEPFIRAHPDQWMMFHPVWETASQVEVPPAAGEERFHEDRPAEVAAGCVSGRED